MDFSVKPGLIGPGFAILRSRLSQGACYLLASGQVSRTLPKLGNHGPWTHDVTGYLDCAPMVVGHLGFPRKVGVRHELYWVVHRSWEHSTNWWEIMGTLHWSEPEDSTTWTSLNMRCPKRIPKRLQERGSDARVYISLGSSDDGISVGFLDVVVFGMKNHIKNRFTSEHPNLISWLTMEGVTYLTARCGVVFI